MKWKKISKFQPLDGQRIMVYHPKLEEHLDEFLSGGIWPIAIWSEKENACKDEDGTLFEITMWTEFILPPEVKIEAPKTKLKRLANKNGFNFWC